MTKTQITLAKELSVTDTVRQAIKDSPMYTPMTDKNNNQETQSVEETIENIEEFIAAVKVANNYVRLSPSLAGQDLLVADSIKISGKNITIDGSDARGAVFKPADNYPDNHPMLI